MTDEHCPYCHGSGKVKDPVLLREQDCPNCIEVAYISGVDNSPHGPTLEQRMFMEDPDGYQGI